jgi:hypothetical protein
MLGIKRVILRKMKGWCEKFTRITLSYSPFYLNFVLVSDFKSKNMFFSWRELRENLEILEFQRFFTIQKFPHLSQRKIQKINEQQFYCLENHSLFNLPKLFVDFMKKDLYNNPI